MFDTGINLDRSADIQQHTLAGSNRKCGLRLGVKHTAAPNSAVLVDRVGGRWCRRELRWPEGRGGGTLDLITRKGFARTLFQPGMCLLIKVKFSSVAIAKIGRITAI